MIEKKTKIYSHSVKDNFYSKVFNTVSLTRRKSFEVCTDGSTWRKCANYSQESRCVDAKATMYH